MPSCCWNLPLSRPLISFSKSEAGCHSFSFPQTGHGGSPNCLLLSLLTASNPIHDRSSSPSVSTATKRRQQATSPSPSTSAHRPAASWSSDRPLEEEETGSAVKQIHP
ncbi:hypothetical protein Peur_024082 [Populus x canadensis]